MAKTDGYIFKKGSTDWKKVPTGPGVKMADVKVDDDVEIRVEDQVVAGASSTGGAGPKVKFAEPDSLLNVVKEIDLEAASDSPAAISALKNKLGIAWGGVSPMALDVAILVWNAPVVGVNMADIKGGSVISIVGRIMTIKLDKPVKIDGSDKATISFKEGAVGAYGKAKTGAPPNATEEAVFVPCKEIKIEVQCTHTFKKEDMTHCGKPHKAWAACWGLWGSTEPMSMFPIDNLKDIDPNKPSDNYFGISKIRVEAGQTGYLYVTGTHGDAASVKFTWENGPAIHAGQLLKFSDYECETVCNVPFTTRVQTDDELCFIDDEIIKPKRRTIPFLTFDTKIFRTTTRHITHIPVSNKVLSLVSSVGTLPKFKSTARIVAWSSATKITAYTLTDTSVVMGWAAGILNPTIEIPIVQEVVLDGALTHTGSPAVTKVVTDISGTGPIELAKYAYPPTIMTNWKQTGTAFNVAIIGSSFAPFSVKPGPGSYTYPALLGSPPTGGYFPVNGGNASITVASHVTGGLVTSIGTAVITLCLPGGSSTSVTVVTAVGTTASPASLITYYSAQGMQLWGANAPADITAASPFPGYLAMTNGSTTPILAVDYTSYKLDPSSITIPTLFTSFQTADVLQTKFTAISSVSRLVAYQSVVQNLSSLLEMPVLQSTAEGDLLVADGTMPELQVLAAETVMVLNPAGTIKVLVDDPASPDILTLLEETPLGNIILPFFIEDDGDPKRLRVLAKPKPIFAVGRLEKRKICKQVEIFPGPVVPVDERKGVILLTPVWTLDAPLTDAERCLCYGGPEKDPHVECKPMYDGDPPEGVVAGVTPCTIKVRRVQLKFCVN